MYINKILFKSHDNQKKKKPTIDSQTQREENKNYLYGETWFARKAAKREKQRNM